MEYLYVKEKTAEAIYNYFEEQYRFMDIPREDLMLVEKYKSGHKNYLIFHSMYGRRVNDALSRAFGFVMGRLGGRDIEVGFRFAVWSEQVAFLLSYGTILAIVIPLAIIGILFWRSWHYDSGEAVKADGEAERLDTTSAPNLPSPPSGEPSRGWLRPSRGDRRRRDLHPPPLSDI